MSKFNEDTRVKIPATITELNDNEASQVTGGKWEETYEGYYRTDVVNAESNLDKK